MQIFHQPKQAKNWCQSQREAGKSIGFIATMGALHDGHLALVKCAVEQNDIVCASIFVNPLQFNNADDLKNYPRSFDEDAQKLKQAGCNMLFTGKIDDFFPDQSEKTAALPIVSQASLGLEGEYRPGHFKGVWKIVEKLFYTVGDCRAYFGEKDFQQVMLVTELSKYLSQRENDKNLLIKIVPCPTLREKSGLALSSRNLRLTDKQKEQALVIYETLIETKKLWQNGERNANYLESFMLLKIEQSKLELEYAAIRDPQNWTADTPDYRLNQAQALIAGYIGEIRLIDNMALHK